MNKSLLKYCLIFIAVCFVTSISILYVTHLKEPVFLEHYYELAAYENVYVELSYITNNYDDEKLLDVSFPQLEGTDIFVAYSEMTSSSRSTNNRYKMQTVRVQLMCESHEFTNDIVLDNAIIRLTNGKIVSGDIGKIVLFPNNREKGIKLVETLMSSSSSIGVSFSDARFLDDVSINNLPFVLENETDGILRLFFNNLSSNDTLGSTKNNSQNKLEITSNESYRELEMSAFTSESRVLDKNSLPFLFRKDEHVYMVSEFIIEDNDPRRYNCYNIHRRIYFENAQGEIDYHILYNMNYQPYFSGMDYYNFLKHKGVK